MILWSTLSIVRKLFLKDNTVVNFSVKS